MKKLNRILTYTVAALTSLSLIASPALGQEAKAPAKSSKKSKAADKAVAKPAEDAAERVNVDAIKEKYWAGGEEAEMGVVQNRLYSKERKWNLGLYTGVFSTDPFLSVYSLGASLGYNFTEYLSLHAIGIKHSASPSSALTAFEAEKSATTNYNKPLNYLGLEGLASILYGKLSVLGKAIIYYDMHLSLGLGRTKTENGAYFTPSVGIGQQVYISKLMSVRVDYRFMPYKENITERKIPHLFGRVLGERTNYSHAVTLGLSFLIGGGK